MAACSLHHIYTVVKGSQREYEAPSYLARELIFKQSPNLLHEVLDLLFTSEYLSGCGLSKAIDYNIHIHMVSCRFAKLTPPIHVLME